MSNIYIQEPPTCGKVLLRTTVGDIDVELWTKETPKACRNFIQLCMEGYYDGTIFHRVIKGFIVQGGDPEGTGFGGESIYGGPFKNELHSRLRFVRRGLVAMANSGKEDNGSQFFFTLGACPELQNKHTIFGKVTGNTLFNMIKLEESLIDSDDRPLYPHKILSCKILDNPFNDIVPRVFEKEKLVVEEKVQEKVKKNYSLLSFGEEAEEDEAEVDAVAQEFRGKSKSSHDLAKDPKLSSVPAVAEDATSSAVSNSSLLETVRKKLKVEREESKQESRSPVRKDGSESEMDDTRKAIRNEIKQIKKELKKKESQKSTEEASTDSGTKRKFDEPFFTEYKSKIADYKKRKTLLAAKGEEREKQTLAILAKFQDKLSAANKDHDSTTEEPKTSEDTEEADDDDNEWLSHELHFEDDTVVAKDVNLPSADRYDITDPRNPINQRRRHADKQKETKGIRA